jgi:hypothetical protein
MSIDIYDKTRLVVAKRHDEKYPFVIGGVADSSSEIIDQDEWDQIKREWAAKWLGPDASSYEFVEIVVEIPNADLAAMFEARHVVPASVTKDETA